MGMGIAAGGRDCIWMQSIHVAPILFVFVPVGPGASLAINSSRVMRLGQFSRSTVLDRPS
jgi:hypothetical protein